MDLNNFSHGFGQLTYHVVFVPKFRRPIFNDAFVKKACEMLFYKIAGQYGYTIHELQIMPDHVHLFVGMKPDDSVSKAVQRFKGISARRLFQRFPELSIQLWRGHIWSAGKFYRSVGNVTIDTIRHYIAQSQGEWKFPEPPCEANECSAPGQKTINDFMV
jgi:putative transposase